MITRTRAALYSAQASEPRRLDAPTPWGPSPLPADRSSISLGPSCSALRRGDLVPRPLRLQAALAGSGEAPPPRRYKRRDSVAAAAEDSSVHPLLVRTPRHRLPTTHPTPPLPPRPSRSLSLHFSRSRLIGAVASVRLVHKRPDPTRRKLTHAHAITRKHPSAAPTHTRIPDLATVLDPDN